MTDLSTLTVSLIAIGISIISVVISIISSYYAREQSNAAKEQSNASIEQSKTANKNLELYKKELKSTNEHLLLQEKRKHYKKLIDSMQNWVYDPCSEGEMITSSVNTIMTGIQSSTNLIIGKYPVRYLEQAKSHLKAYKEIWKLYEDAPRICQLRKQQNQDLENYLESRLKAEIDGKKIRIIQSDIKWILMIVRDNIFYNIRNPEKEGIPHFQLSKAIMLYS